VFDYAHYAEHLLGLTAYVAFGAHAWNNFDGTVERFRARFGERLLMLERGFDEVDDVLAREEISLLHCLRAEGISSHVSSLPHVRTLVHAVFFGTDTREGDVHARISPCVPGVSPVVPHIVRPIDNPDDGPDLRAELGIPPSATVIGRHGAYETFDIEHARAALLEAAAERPDLYFVLMHTPPFAPPRPNIIHLPRTSDAERKAAFIRTCDAMLHARLGGETFGLAVAEFSSAGRPVLTSSEHHDNGNARFHLDTLAAHGPHCRALFYRDKPSLLALLRKFGREDRLARNDWNAYGACAPETVMRRFKEVFLDGPPNSNVLGAEAPPPPPAAAVAQPDERTRAAWAVISKMDRGIAALRTLPLEQRVTYAPPRPFANVFKGEYVLVRFAPSISAAAAEKLPRGAVRHAIAAWGAWICIGEDRWVLTKHPLYGELMREPN
jgi:hypothetical protein